MAVEIEDYQEIRADVLKKFNEIETLLNEKITNFLQINDNKKGFMMNIVLNSSVINFGAKVKILINMNDKSIQIDKIRHLMNCRNAFAHVEAYKFIHKDLAKDEIISEQINLLVMNGQGKFELRNIHKEHKLFIKDYQDILKQLKEH